MQNFLSLEIPLAIFICIIYIFAALALHVIQDHYGYTLWFHESSFSCIVGFVIGGILKYVTGTSVVFNGDLFFFMILPPIIFSAGYSLRRKRFFQNIHLIMLFGIGGTIVNFLLIAFGAYYFPTLFPNYTLGVAPFSWQKSLLFASVLAGSDEVSALSLIPIDVFPRMGALIFGEGVMNDALSIVLFESLKPLDSGDHVDFTMWKLLQCICIQLAGAVTIGLVTGLLLSMIMKQFSVLRTFPAHQTALVMLFGYLSYTLAQCMEISGILTVFVCGVTMAHYAWHSLAKQAQVATRLSTASLSEIAEGFAFSYVGLSYWSYAHSDFLPGFAGYMIAVILLARAITTFSIAGLLKWQKLRGFDMSLSDQQGLFLGGIVRGCLCWAQVLQLHHCPVMITTTLLIIMVTSIAGGVLLPMLLPRLLSSVNANTTFANNNEAVLDSEFMPHLKASANIAIDNQQQYLYPPLLAHPLVSEHGRLQLASSYSSLEENASPPGITIVLPSSKQPKEHCMVLAAHDPSNATTMASKIPLPSSKATSAQINNSGSSSSSSSGSSPDMTILSTSQLFHTALDIDEHLEDNHPQQDNNDHHNNVYKAKKSKVQSQQAPLPFSPIQPLSLELPTISTAKTSKAKSNSGSSHATTYSGGTDIESLEANNNSSSNHQNSDPQSPPIVLHSHRNRKPKTSGKNNMNGDANESNVNDAVNESMMIFDQSSWTSQEIRTASYLFLQWIRFDENVMKPWFGGSLPDHRRRQWLKELMKPTNHTNSNNSNNINVNNMSYHSNKSYGRYNRLHHNEDAAEYDEENSHLRSFLASEYDAGQSMYEEKIEDAELEAEEEAEKENLLSPFLKKQPGYYQQYQQQRWLQQQQHQQQHEQMQLPQSKQSQGGSAKKNVSFFVGQDRHGGRNTALNNSNMLIKEFPPTFQLPLDDDDEQEDEEMKMSHPTQQPFASPQQHPHHRSVRPIARGLFFHSPPSAPTAATTTASLHKLALQHPSEAANVDIIDAAIDDDDVCLYSTTPILPSTAGNSSATGMTTVSSSMTMSSAAMDIHSKQQLVQPQQPVHDASFLSPITVIPSPPIVTTAGYLHAQHRDSNTDNSGKNNKRNKKNNKRK